MTRQIYRSTEMIRNAIVVALRSSTQPMGSGELVRHMPWQRREHRAYHGGKRPCDTPWDAPSGRIKVLACTGEIHTVDWRPTSSELNGHLRALCRQGLVHLAEGTVPGRRHLWELTAAGAARGDITTARVIVDLDATPRPQHSNPITNPAQPARDPKPLISTRADRVMAHAQPPPMCGCQATIDRLTADNERLRRTVQCLISANGLISDAVGIWTMPNIPNN